MQSGMQVLGNALGCGFSTSEACVKGTAFSRIKEVLQVSADYSGNVSTFDPHNSGQNTLPCMLSIMLDEVVCGSV